MKNKQILFSRVLALTVIVSVLVSCFVVFSSADTSVPESSSSGYDVDIQSGYYLFNPDSRLIESVSDAKFYEFEFFVGENYSLKFTSVVSISLQPDTDYTDVYFSSGIESSASVVICRVYDDGTVKWSHEEYKLLYVPAQTVNSKVLDFLGIFCVKAADPGWYEFNYNSPLLGSFDCNLPLFTPNSSEYMALPSVIYGRVVNQVNFVDRPFVPSFCIYFDQVDNDHLRFCTSSGFTSDLPGTVIWNGRLYFENPQFFNSAQQYYWFSVLFTPSWFLADPNADYDRGFSDGEAYGYDVGKGEGLAQGFQEGKDTWYPIGLKEGEDIGYDKGFNASATENFGKNLLSDTLSAPWNALMSFKLFDLPGGNPFTFGTLVSTGMSIALLIIFLKLFAGG